MQRSILAVFFLVFGLCLATGCSDDESHPADADVTVFGGDLGTIDSPVPPDTEDDQNQTDAADDSPIENELPDWIDEESAEERCEDFCALLAECELDGTVCEQSCLADLAADPSYLGVLTCVQDRDCASMGECLETDVPISPTCEEACELFDDCDAYELFGLPPGQGCIYACSGHMFGESETGVEEVIACFDAALGDDRCDILEAMTCIDGASCEALCGPVHECPDGSALATHFSEDGSCEALCETMSAGQMVGFQICVDVSDCNATCHELPDDVSEDCSSACDVAIELCEDETSAQGAVLCDWVCEAFQEALPGADADGATECINETFTECPYQEGAGEDDGEGMGYASTLGICMLWNDDCEPLCDALQSCNPEFNYLECIAGCSMNVSQDQYYIDEIQDCIDDADSCNETWECVPVLIDALAQEMCGRVCGWLDAEPECSSVEYECWDQCPQLYEQEGLAAIAHTACALSSPCTSVPDCMNETITTDADCTTACEDALDTSGDQPCSDWDRIEGEDVLQTLCERSCSGFAHAYPEAVDAESCVESLGDDCTPNPDACFDAE